MAVLAVALGSALVIALLETDSTTPEPERVAEVRYVTETKVVYVDRVVPQPPVIVYVPTPVPVEILVAVPPSEEPTVVEVSVPPPAPVPLPEPPHVVVAPPIEPPVVVAAVCEHRGNGRGKQVGVCRKQGFP